MIITAIIMAPMTALTLVLLGGRMLRGKDSTTRLVAAIIPASIIIAAGVYGAIGAFGTADAPLSGRGEEIAAARETATAEAEEQRDALDAARRLVIENPDDIEARFALAEAAAIAGAATIEIDTLNHILEVTGDASLHAMIAEALTREADGIVTIKALAAIDRSLAANPDDWRARYFKGLYLSQNDDDQGALDLWVPLAEELFGSPVYPAVAAAIEQSAARLGVDTASLLPQTETEMTDDDIRGMVENLEARLLAGDTHEEREAWVMLIRSLMIINETERRDAALTHYLTLDLDEPADSATIINMAEVMLPPDNLPVIIPDVLIALIDKARELTPDQPSVLFFSGLMARQQGDRDALAASWGRLRQLIEDDNPLAALLDAELEAASQ